MVGIMETEADAISTLGLIGTADSLSTVGLIYTWEVVAAVTMKDVVILWP